MAAGQTIHKQRQVKRTNNRLKNEQLRAKGQHSKQIRNRENVELARQKAHYGGLGRNERRYLEKNGVNIDLIFDDLWQDLEKVKTAKALRDEIKKLKKADRHAAEMSRLAAATQKLSVELQGLSEVVNEATNNVKPFSEFMTQVDAHAQSLQK